jgi:uncharacterized membrane protein
LRCAWWLLEFFTLPNLSHLYASCPIFCPPPADLVYISGVIEVLLGIGLLIPNIQQLSAWGLVALFVAVYPANLNMAFNHIHIDGVPDGWWFQAIRLPFQFVLIAWAYWLTRGESRAVSQ